MQLRSFTLHLPIFSSKIIKFPELLANFVLDAPYVGAIIVFLHGGPAIGHGTKGILMNRNKLL